MMRTGSFVLAATLGAAPVAAESPWHFGFNQGTAEYAVGSFAEGGSSLALSCSEAGLRPGSGGVRLRRAGFRPTQGTPATFKTEAGSVTFRLDGDGAVDYADIRVAPRFATLWRLLRRGRTLTVAFGPGAPMRFPLSGAAALLGPRVCPRQLAGR